MINNCINTFQYWIDNRNINIAFLLVKEFPLVFNKKQLNSIHKILAYIEKDNNNNINIKLIHLFFSGIIQNFEKGLEYFFLSTIDKKNSDYNLEHTDTITKMLSYKYTNNIGINLSEMEYDVLVSYFTSIIQSDDFLKWNINHQFRFLSAITSIFMFERPFVFKKLCNLLGRIFNIYLQNIKNNPYVFMSLYDGLRMLFWKAREQPYRYVIHFDEAITKPYAKYLDQYHNQFKHLQRSKKKEIKNVCFMLTNTYCVPGYSPAYLLKTIHKAHYDYGNSNIKFYLYSIGGFARDINHEYENSLKKANITIREFNSLINHEDYLKILNSANSDNIDVAIMNMNFSTQAFLFSAQIAPYQIYLNHGFSAFTPSNMDHCIWFNNEVVPQFLQEYTVANHYNITKIDYWKYYDTNIGAMNDELKQEKEKELLKYPINKIILGNMQSLERITKEFLEIIVAILQNNENIIFICCGSGDMHLINSYRDKHQLHNKLFTPGFINPHVYGHMIDIVMNTPFSSALSVLDFLVKGKIVVSFPKGTIEPIEIDKIGLIVSSDEEYIDVVSRLIRDKDFYKQIKNKINNNFNNYINSQSGVQDFENLMIDLYEKSIS